MFSLRAQRRTSLLAVFLLLWGLVVPAFAQLNSSQANVLQIEVCTAQGIKTIDHGAVETPTTGHHAGAEHCALCCPGGAFAMPRQESQAGIRTESEPGRLPTLHVALPQQVVPLHAPPRAPPVLSAT